MKRLALIHGVNLNMLGHLERAYQKAPYTTHGGIDIRSDEAYEEFIYPILSEMLEVYGPVEYFHCGRRHHQPGRLDPLQLRAA